ncbi:uncharacterized protein LOC142317448 [Lycorma delicatula]|uniref:uncharacterized protein LOC142317448 n=1 Tax=Lycorma delicatula TaxID=130591 RepID=UPI003F513270
MMPFRNLKEAQNWSLSGRTQGGNSSSANENFNNAELNDAPVMQSVQNRNFSISRAVTGRMNPISSNQHASNINNMQHSSSIISGLHQPLGSIYRIQPNSGFISQWQNQQMTFDMMTAPVRQSAPGTGFQPNKTVQFVTAEKELGVMERRMYSIDSPTQQVMSSPVVQKKSHFKFALPSTSTSNDKINIKRESMKKEFLETSTHHLVGSVEQVIRWYQMVKSAGLFAIYEVHGVLESKHVKSLDIVIITIKQEPKGPTIQGIFCAVDRPFMDHLQPGDKVVCVGRMKGAKKMQILNAWHDFSKLEDYNRISFLCQRALQEAVLMAPEP